MMDWLHYILLAILQGIAEILPISSSGHLALYQAIFNINEGYEGTFSIFLHGGSLLALLVYFSPSLWRLLQSVVMYVQGKRTTAIVEDMRFIGYLMLASLPAGIVGVFLSDTIDTIFSSLIFVGVGFLITAGLLFFVYRVSNRRQNDTHSLKSALGAGFAQVLGIFPGISRSGSTISGALLTGLSLNKAKEFSFFMFLPISAGSFILSLDRLQNVDTINGTLMFVAVLITFGVSWITLHLVLKRLKVSHFPYFSMYLVVIGIITLILAGLP
jgi:undecaprenyl-diphosphatase